MVSVFRIFQIAIGSWVQAEAAAYAGYEFIGWYEGKNLVSTELEYNFRVSRDMELTARFKERQ